MRRFPIVTALITVAVIVAAVGGWMLFAKTEHDRYVAVDKVREQHSEYRIQYELQHTDGPIGTETWTFHNVDGRSSVTYVATNRTGLKATFDEYVEGYSVTFLFQKLVLDGIWDLESRPFRGSAETLHVVAIEQTADTAHGSHRFQFSDANYIANEAGREYEIHLDPKKPLPNLVNLKSTSTADPRYKKIAGDFAEYGSPTFRRTMAAARAKLGG
jgi:hypothetical protein